MASKRQIVKETEDKIYVALGKEVKENKSILIWALQNSGGKRICIIHVHQPAQMIPLPCLGGKFPASSLQEQKVKAYQEIERKNMEKTLNEYLLISNQMGVGTEKLYIEMDCIEKGILELVSQHGIRKLVMGAAAEEKRHSMKMMDLKSKKAIYVGKKAPASCHIWFVYKGSLIRTRECSLDGAGTEVASSSLQASPNIETGQSNHLRTRSLTLGNNNPVKLTNPVLDLFHRIRSVNLKGRGGRVTELTSPDGTLGLSTPFSRQDTRSSDDCDRLSRRSPSQGSKFSSYSSSGVVDVLLTPIVRTGESENGLDLSTLPKFKEDLQHSSPPSVLDGSIADTLYDQLQQAKVEAANSRQEAFEEAVKRVKAEKDAIEAIRKKSLLESQIAESDRMVRELEQKIFSAVELLQNYKKERDELQMERDNALKEAEELRKSRAEASTSNMPQFFSEFSFSEIEEATNYFDPSLNIGEGGYGSIYRGVLRHSQVAKKRLHSNSMQGPSEFQQEVHVLSKMRHPNLPGASPEAWTLVYEYLPNGCLEDRLCCRDNSPPLSWQTRIRIATELCSVLIFLHSSKPHSIIHGNLKPANILLDANFVTKLSDFGIRRLISHEGSSSNNSTLRTDPMSTFAYMDPEFLSTGDLNAKSDVYSFGIILLRLLTGRQAFRIIKEVQYALDTGNLKTLLDPLAGDWPFLQAEQLAHSALRCCEMNRRCRPDLGSDVWKILEPMRASCGGSLSFPDLGSQEHCQPPSYFLCPIFKEVMQDPHVAADGYTYEAEALRGWLDSGHDTSPMTKVRLAHCKLVPNHPLRSAIKEWLQHN